MKPDADTRAAIRCAAFLFAIGLCLLGTSCGSPPTIWKAEARSPDGLWVASVETIQNGGFGSASIDTVVYVQRTNRSEPPTEVLGLSCHGPAPRPYVLDKANAGGTIDLMMKWVTASHLEVTYDNHPDLYLQVVRIGGIDISALDLSSEKDKVAR